MIRLLTLELVFLLLLLLALPVLLIADFPGPDHQPSLSRLVSLTAADPVLFSLPNPSSLPLNSLSLTLKNPNIANRSEINVALLLPDGSTHQSLSFSGANVGDPSTVNLSFTPLSTPLMVNLTTSNTIPETLFIFASDSLLPQYSTTFRPSTLAARFSLIFSSQFSRLVKINPFYLILYLAVILFLTYASAHRR